MNHWDLTSGEKLPLRRRDTGHTIKVVFHGRDTIHAYFSFDPSGDSFELTLASDGSFRDAAGKTWCAEGTSRENRIVIEEPLGEGAHFTRALKQKARKARV